GWSARDSAERAVVENDALLDRRDGASPGVRLSRLLSAGRAALFLASLDAGDPELALTAAATARALGGEAIPAFEAYRAWRTDGVTPPDGAERALHELVLGLPAFASRTGRAAASASRSAPRR